MTGRPIIVHSLAEAVREKARLMPLAHDGTPIERLNPRFEIAVEADFMVRGF